MLGDNLPEDRDHNTDLGPESSLEDSEQIDPSLERSLGDDIADLVDDGKTYIEAELAFQKTRLSFVAGNGKSGLVYVLAALAFLHLALIGLVVGSVFALTFFIGPIWATALVVGVLLIGVISFGLAARKRFGKAVSAFQDEKS